MQNLEIDFTISKLQYILQKREERKEKGNKIITKILTITTDCATQFYCFGYLIPSIPRLKRIRFIIL